MPTTITSNAEGEYYSFFRKLNEILKLPLIYCFSRLWICRLNYVSRVEVGLNSGKLLHVESIDLCFFIWSPWKWNMYERPYRSQYWKHRTGRFYCPRIYNMYCSSHDPYNFSNISPKRIIVILTTQPTRETKIPVIPKLTLFDIFGILLLHILHLTYYFTIKIVKELYGAYEFQQTRY